MDVNFLAIRQNLFSGSHAAIDDWNKFPWHRDARGVIQADKPQSSQALAIDVFGTIKSSRDRDQILGALARECGMSDEGPWELFLEWTDPKNLLKEVRPTQVDAIAFGAQSILVFECKFTETGGHCSQPNVINGGAHNGMRQCNGNYEIQNNPVTGNVSRCALTSKGVLYWKLIPKIFGYGENEDHCPCPFRGEAYQWMRNIVFAKSVASDRGACGTVIASYADGPGLHTATKARAGNLGQSRAAWSTNPLMRPMSYQSILALAKSVAHSPEDWTSLMMWVERKIDAVTSMRSGRV